MKNLSEIFAHLHRLLELEKEEGLQQYQKQMILTPLRERREKGMTWYPVQINAREIGAGENFYLSLERRSHRGQNHSFQVGDSVALFHQSARHEKVSSVSGVIAAVWKDNMRLALPVDELPDWIDDDNLGVDLLFDTVSFKEMEEALGKVAKAENDRLAELRQILYGLQAPHSDLGVLAKFSLPLFHLNPSQNEALGNILSAQDVAIVHGPPGTGKTTTLVEAIKLTLQAENQVLVTAPSNTAVDLLAFRLLAKGLGVLRIGNPARFEEELGPYSLEGQIAQHSDYRFLKKLRRDSEEMRRMAQKYKRSFGPSEREQRRLLYAEANRMRDEAMALEKYIVDDLLRQAQVIAATLVGSVNKYIRYRRFSTVFIDEAAQALEPAAWIPILKAERVILAGDHCQLPPTVKSYAAAQAGLSETLFEKIIQSQPQTATLLRTQYRMNHEIMTFSNEQFYEGRLEADAAVATQRLGQGSDDPLLTRPVEFIDTAGCSFEEMSHSETQSRYNPKEAELLLRHLRQMGQHLAFQLAPEARAEVSLGIISPYQAQVEFIRSLLAEQTDLKELFGSITVHTVDGFQGQERDVMYISLVRSNAKGQIGFLGDTRRMNVALTRARKKLVVIGDSATLAHHRFYEDFLAYTERIQAYQSAWEWMTDE